MKKLIVTACMLAMVMSTLTGCVKKTQESPSEPAAGTVQGDESAAQGEASTTQLPANETQSAAVNEKELNIYTALEDEQVTDYLTEFKEQNPDVTIHITRDSTGIITSKLLAEKDNPIADVVWGLSATSLLVLKQNDMLEGYAPEGVDRILPEFKDAAEVPTWVGIDAWETAWLVNKEVLKSKGIDTVPASYEDLLDPKYEGLIAMPNPASSGTGLLTVNGILQLMGEEKGWEYLDALDKNVAVYTHSGSQPAKEAASGEYGIGISFGYRCINSASEVGPEIAEAVFPSEGSGWDVEANALIKKADQKEISKTFLDWAISDNIMQKYAENYPIVAIGVGSGVPEGYAQNPVDQLIKPMDFENLAKNRETTLDEWTLRYDAKSAQKE